MIVKTEIVRLESQGTIVTVIREWFINFK